MLTKAQRDAIFATYIPALDHLKAIAEACLDDQTIEFLKEVERKTCDFDLTATTYYAALETRFDRYLAHSIGKNSRIGITGTWQRLLSSDRVSAELWFSLTDDADLAEQLLQMIEQGLNFFHPYLPMMAFKRLALLDYFEKHRLNGPKISKDRCKNANITSKFQPQFFSVLDNETGELSKVAANDDGEILKYNL